MRKLGLIGGLATLVASQALVLTPSAEAMTIATLEASRLINSGVLAQTVEPQAAAEVRIDDAVMDSFARGSNPDVLVHFDTRADLSSAPTISERVTRANFVFGQLTSHAAMAQAEARSTLQGFGRSESNLTDTRGFVTLWIDNSIAIAGLTQDELSALAATPGVSRITKQVNIPLPIEEELNLVPPVLLAIEPSISKINAPAVWALGYRGAGIVLGGIDSGVRHTHQSLVNQYRGNTGGGTFNHNYNWFDPYQSSAVPRSTHPHGSHTTGTSVGNDGGTNEIGVAPESKWVHCIGFGNPGAGATDAGLLACGQFMLAPTNVTGGAPNPALAPHSVNNSWGDCGQTYDNWYEGVIDGWIAAGIVPVFSNGNASNCGYSNNPPLNTVGNPGRSGKVLGVGSTGNSNGVYAPHSNKGPTDNPNPGTAQYPDHFGFANLKPNVVAPGVSVRSANNTSDSAYYLSGGTSMSAPAVNGLVGLMWNAAPCLIGDYATTGTIIMDTAVAIPVATGSPSDGPGNIPNQATGWGEIDALAAVNAAIEECEGTGGPQPFFEGELTTSSPTYDNPGGSSTGSGIHYYCAQEFTVDATGSYVIETTSPNTTGTPSDALDTFLALYANAFNPAAPAAPQAFNDDFTGTLTVLPGPYAGTVTATATGFQGAQPGSRLATASLTAGTTYFLVHTSFRETNYVTTGTQGQPVGAFYTGIGGPGNVTLVGTGCTEGGGGDPEIDVAPAALDFTVATGASDSDDLSITNVGEGTLTWAIDTAVPAAISRNASSADTVVGAPSVNGFDLASAFGGPLPRGPVVALTGTDCASDPALIIHDDGTVENGYSGSADAGVTQVRLVDAFTPASYPATLDRACVSFITLGTTSLNYNVVVYDDDGAGGTPGTQLASVPATATAIPGAGSLPNATFYSTDLSSLNISVASGSVFVGVSYTPIPSASGSVFVSSDESVANPIGFAGGYFFTDLDGVWNTIETSFPAYRSLFVRAAFESGGPGPVGCDNPSTIPWLDVGTTSGSADAGETDLSAISVDATGLAAGSYDALLCVTSNDAANPVVEVPVSLTVTGGGGGDVEYSVNPTTLAASQAPNTTTTQTLTLNNAGTQTGTYSIVEAAANGGKQALLGGPTELYSNGPFITNPGAGAGGNDASVLESTILSTYGFGAQQSAGNRVADEFVVPASGWTVDEMTFFTYQTGSTTTSTITGITVQIWDGVPGEAGSNIVFGDETTNVMASTTWSTVYRSIDTAIGDATRPIMEVVADIGGLSLAGGTYWVDFQFNGTLGSGPWAVPITILGQTVTGNALQSLAGVWGPAVDTNFGHQAGFPFVITGTGEGGGGTCDPVDASWLSVSPTSGSTPAGGSSAVTVTYNSTGLTAGTYNAKLCVLSNDSVGNEEIEVPVTLTVTGGGGPFPAPYCAVTVTNDIEPISRVLFEDIANASSPVVNGSPVHEDFLSVQTDLTAGSTVEIRVESNTAGDFTHHIRAFFDWNNDGDLTDAGESYIVGTITNSNGTDGQQAIANIAVPSTATNGPVRMRVIAQWNISPTDPCATLSYGQAEDYTVNVSGGGGGGDPTIAVAPGALSLTADVGASDSDDLSISNVGAGVLTWSIDEAEPASELIEIAAAKSPTTIASLDSNGGSSWQDFPITLAPRGGVSMSQTTNTNIAAANSAACPTGENRLMRRFYFNEHPGVANPASITSIDVGLQEAAATTSLTVNLYTLPASTPTDTIPVGSLTLIGTATTAINPGLDGTIINVPVTGNVADTSASNLVVEFVGANWYIGASNGGQTHPGFIVAPDCGITAPTAIDTLGAAFVNTHIIMVVNTTGGVPPVGCDAPSSIPWLSASPASGSALAGETDLSTITANATGLATGTYDALLCVNSNDAANPTVVVPVEFTVEAGVDDGIFCDGFEVGGDGSCGGGGPGDPDIVIIEDINFVPNPDFTGGSIQWVDGTTCNCDTAPFNFNVYGDASTLQFFWPLNASGNEGGVTLDGGSTYALLSSGATIGSTSEFLVVTAAAATAPFTAAGTGYLGFKFDNGGTVNYGYAEVTRGAGGRPFTIVSVAYNSAGAPITIP